MIHHEGTQGTTDTKENNKKLLFFVFVVPCVPSC
jgi:hypothetical protein